MILPLPVFFALFRVIDGLGHTKTTNGVVQYLPRYLDSHTRMYHDIVTSHGRLVAFGMDLSKGALSHHNGILAAAPFWIALLIMAGTSYLQSAMMMSRNQAQAAANPQMRMMKYLAPLFALFCIKFPAGVVVYYGTSNICRILQQDAMYRFDPKVKTLVAAEVEEVEELTHEIDERQKNRPGYTPPRGAKPPAAPAPPPTKPARGASAPTGRSRFRDLLAAAAEQQKAQQDAKNQTRTNGSDGTNGKGSAAGGTSGRPARPAAGGGTAKTGGGGTAKTGGTAQPAGGGGRNRPQGNRTNRKRRGR